MYYSRWMTALVLFLWLWENIPTRSNLWSKGLISLSFPGYGLFLQPSLSGRSMEQELHHTEEMHACMCAGMLACAQLYFSTFPQFKAPCLGNGATHSRGLFPYQLTWLSLTEGPTGQPSVDNPSLTLPLQVILDDVRHRDDTWMDRLIWQTSFPELSQFRRQNLTTPVCAAHTGAWPAAGHLWLQRDYIGVS